MQIDCAPKVGDVMENGGRVIAIHKIAESSDQNEYMVLALLTYEDSSMPYQYATWHLYANEHKYITVAGDYFFGNGPDRDKYALFRAVSSFMKRSNITLQESET